MNNLLPSGACLALVKSFETCRLVAYQDGAGVWTIGWGHTLNVQEGDTCVQEMADMWLQIELESAGAYVNRLVVVDLTQGQFDALSSFCYNEGVGRLRSSTLLRLVNQGRFDEAGNEFGKWVYADGQVEKGLVRRRAAERQLFDTPAGTS